MHGQQYIKKSVMCSSSPQHPTISYK